MTDPHPSHDPAEHGVPHRGEDRRDGDSGRMPARTGGEPRPQRPLVTKVGVAALTLLLLFFAGMAVFSAFGFIMAPQPVAKLIGVAVLGVVVVGMWALWRELRFGLLSERMASLLAAEGSLPADDLPRSPGGRIDRAAADAQFETYRIEAEAAPQSWRAWYRLGLAYDASGDRRRARGAIHTACRLFSEDSRAARG